MPYLAYQMLFGLYYGYLRTMARLNDNIYINCWSNGRNFNQHTGHHSISDSLKKT